MKNIKSFKYLALGLLVASSFMQTGCSSDYLDTIPSEKGSSETVNSSLENIYMALNGLHARLVSQDLENQGLGGEPGFIIAREASGDDMTWDTQTWHQGYLNWSFNTNPSTSYNDGIWETYYKYILNTNMILEVLEKNYSNSTEELAGRIKGECLTIRAWAHFQLVQYYAKAYRNGQDNTQLGVPYRESSEITPMARNTVEDVYSKINTDLDNAITLMEGYEANDVNHHCKATALGMKARVLLTQQKYTEAATEAALCIEAAEASGFKMMTKDQLAELAGGKYVAKCGFSNITTDTKDAMYATMTQNDQTVYFYSFYAFMSWNFNASSVRTGIKCINQDTYDKMSETDLRRTWWDPTGKAAVPGSSYNKRAYQNRKFTARSSADAVGDVAFMRLSEIYLIAAEAYARSNQDTKAKGYLETFVDNRDTEGYQDSGKTGNELAEEIMTHRRIELWGEGFRWFDLKRLNLSCERKGSNYDKSFCVFLTKGQDEDGWYFEIPKKETDFNPLMEKNY